MYSISNAKFTPSGMKILEDMTEMDLPSFFSQVKGSQEFYNKHKDMLEAGGVICGGKLRRAWLSKDMNATKGKRSSHSPWWQKPKECDIDIYVTDEADVYGVCKALEKEGGNSLKTAEMEKSLKNEVKELERKFGVQIDRYYIDKGFNKAFKKLKSYFNKKEVKSSGVHVTYNAINYKIKDTKYQVVEFLEGQETVPKILGNFDIINCMIGMSKDKIYYHKEALDLIDKKILKFNDNPISMRTSEFIHFSRISRYFAMEEHNEIHNPKLFRKAIAARRQASPYSRNKIDWEEKSLYRFAFSKLRTKDLSQFLLICNSIDDYVTKEIHKRIK
jgi:hypothetical protein